MYNVAIFLIILLVVMLVYHFDYCTEPYTNPAAPTCNLCRGLTPTACLNCSNCQVNRMNLCVPGGL